MAEKYKNTKVFRDPVHGLITFDKDEEKVLLELIDTPEFQRMRRIRQLGVAWVAYHGAIHTRFAHSLGVCHLAGIYMDKLYKYYGKKLYKSKSIFMKKRKLVRCAALLHDIGHGPFSHIFEATIKKIKAKDNYKFSHENWTSKIIASSSTEINKILIKFNINPDDIVKIIERTYSDPVIVNIVSSQFDADRMDYIQRDSLFTGVKYGIIDQEWLIHALRYCKIDENKTKEKVIAIDASKGKNSIVNFLYARRNLFQQVYFHHKVRAAEIQLKSILKRIGYLIGRNTLDINESIMDFIKTPSKELQVEQYLQLDDFLLISQIQILSKKCNDKTLKTLCGNFTNNKIFKNEKIINHSKLISKLINEKNSFNECIINQPYNENEGIDFNYFHGIDETKTTYYKNEYSKSKKPSEDDNKDKEARNEVWVMYQNGHVKDLSTFNEINAIMGSEDDKIGNIGLCFNDSIFDREKIKKYLND